MSFWIHGRFLQVPTRRGGLGTHCEGGRDRDVVGRRLAGAGPGAGPGPGPHPFWTVALRWRHSVFFEPGKRTSVRVGYRLAQLSALHLLDFSG